MTANTRYLFHRVVSIAWIGALLWICAARLHHLPFHWGRSALMAVGGLGPFGSILWWGWIDQRIERINVSKRGLRWGHAVRSLWAIYILVMSLFMILLMLGSGWVDLLPDAAIVWIMLWNLLMACFVAPASVWMLIRTMFATQRWLVRLRSTGSDLHLGPRPAGNKLDSRPGDIDEHGSAAKALSRRRLLIGAAALPLVGTTAAVIVNKRQEGRFLVRRITMQMPRLPNRLRGLTISHVSDIHTGRLFRPEHLPALVDAVNSLNSDLVAVTGDIIDQSNDFLPVTCDAIAQFEHRYGRYVVMGNHDVIDDSEGFVQYVSSREPNFLIDRHLTAEIGGERIQIAGMGWPIAQSDGDDDMDDESRVARTLSNTDPQLFTLGLVHHPHDFDDLRPHGVDLTLAGHTHGGLLMLTPPGASWRIGVGNLMFRYIWGEYYRGHSAMYLNAGVGNWFPVRINAPAEIVQIRLM